MPLNKDIVLFYISKIFRPGSLAAQAREKSHYMSETQMAKFTRKAHKKTHKKTHKRKMSPGAMRWRKKVMDAYKELKAKNPNARLGEAMKLAASRK